MEIENPPKAYSEAIRGLRPEPLDEETLVRILGEPL
jgi:hypothetical protein